MSVAAFGSAAPTGFGANRNPPSSPAIATSITIGTPGGVLTLAHVATITEQTWLGKDHAVISGYDVAQSTDAAITTANGVGHILDLGATDNLTYTNYGTWTIDTSTAGNSLDWPGMAANTGMGPAGVGTATFSSRIRPPVRAPCRGRH